MFSFNAARVARLDQAIARDQGWLEHFRSLGRPDVVRQYAESTGRLREQRAAVVDADAKLQRRAAELVLADLQREPVRIHARRNR